MKFIGRIKELGQIRNEISQNNFSFMLIYGRRRIGKSELVKQVLTTSKVKNIYYECKQITQESNVKSICSLLEDSFKLPSLGFSTFEDILDYIFKLSLKEKIIFVLDEYPYLRENVKGLDSIIQSLIDKYKDKSKLKLVLLGSYVETMKALLEHSNPLFGRVSLTINLKQMDYYESSLFYPKFNEEDKIRFYCVLGGVPYYNSLVNEKKSFKENVINLIASEGARLENEVSMYLNSEISKIVNANEVILALAKGFSKYSDILSQSHVSSAPTLIDVLEKLTKMEIIEKKAPINDENNKRKAGYYICDNLSLFYYRYIFKYSSQLKIIDANVFYDKYISKDFEENYVPHRFEDICKQYLIRQNKAGKISPIIEKIGKYYYDDPINHTNGEFDIVTQDEKGYVFYEVKFKKQKLSKSAILKEIEQIKQTGLNPYKYVFITRSGFQSNFDKKEFNNVEEISIKELF